MSRHQVILTDVCCHSDEVLKLCDHDLIKNMLKYILHILINLFHKLMDVHLKNKYTHSKGEA